MQEKLTERQKREKVAYQFSMQAMPRFGMEIKKRSTNYRLVLHDLALKVELTAMTLEQSFDFYVYRLNKAAHRVDLVVCQRHNAALPVRVLELDTGNMYQPGAIPPIEREQRRKRNHEETLLFVSMLLAGVDGAYEKLYSMPLRTRQRYLALRDQYLRPRTGRPWAS